MNASNRKELQLPQSPQTRFNVAQVEQEEAESLMIKGAQESMTMTVRRKRTRCLPNPDPMLITTSSKDIYTVGVDPPIMGTSTSTRRSKVNDSMNDNDKCFGNSQKKRRLALNANNDLNLLNLNANDSMDQNQNQNQNSNLVSPDRFQKGLLVHHNAKLVSTSSSIIISQDSDCENEIIENDIDTSIHTQHDPSTYMTVSPFCGTNKPTPTQKPPHVGGIAFDLDQCFDSQHSNSPICPSASHPSISSSVMDTSSNSIHGRTKHKQQSKLPWSSSYSQTTNNSTTNRTTIQDKGLSLFQKVTSSSHTSSNPKQNNFTISGSNNSNTNYNINSNSHGGYDYICAEMINGNTCLTQSVGATTSSTYLSQGRGQQHHQLQEISDSLSNFNTDTTIVCHVCERPSKCHENKIDNKNNNNSSSNNHTIHCNDSTINTNISIYDYNNSENYTPKQRFMTANKKQTNSLYNYFNISNKTIKTHVNTNTSTCSNTRKDIPFKSNPSTNHTIATPCTSTSSSQTSVNTNFTNCSYCDRPTCCISCIATCDSCTKTFCKFCYTINYDWIVDRYFCPDCNDCNMASTSSGSSSNSNGCSDLMEKMDLS